MDFIKSFGRSANAAFIAFLFCSALLFPRLVSAQDPPAATAVGATKGPSSRISPSEHLHARFFLTLQLIFQERYAEAGDEIHGLLDEGRDYGYRSFPEFSALFLKEAERAYLRDKELAAFFVRQAMLLSPNDISTSLSAFAFSDLIEKKALWKHLRDSLWPSLRRPTVLFPVLANSVMLLLTALTIAALIGGFVQLLRHGEIVFRYITRFVPRNYRGVFGPVLVLLVIAVPLLWGPGMALVCWSVILGRSLRHCRWFPLLVGLLFLGWTQAIKYALPLKASISSQLSRVVDSVNANSMVEDARPILTAALESDSKNPLLAMSLARVLLFEGALEEGEKMLRLADGLVDGAGEISRVSRLNLAVLAIRQQRWDEARQILEKDETLGGTRFEVIYNLALVYLAQMDIEQYRKYYTRAQNYDPSEWQRLDSQQGQQHLPVWSSLHTSGFLRPFLSLPTQAEVVPKMKAASDTLAASLVRGASPAFLGLLGGALVLASFVRRSRAGRQWLEHHAAQSGSDLRTADSSLLWSLLPGGVFLAGNRPVIGVLFVALCFSTAFVATGWPLHFLPLSAYPLSLQRYAATAFLVAYGIGFIVPVLVSTFRRPLPAGGSLS